MESIELCIQQLITAIEDSSEYREYKLCEAKIKKEPDLFNRVNEFRESNFRLQNSGESSGFVEIMGQLSRESDELHRIPVVHDYLQSELNICRLLQKISLKICGNLDIHIPIQ